MKYAILTFTLPIAVPPRWAEKLRGFFANRYRNNPLFHNHTDDGKDIYQYPKIQYKVVQGQFTITGICEGADLISEEFVKHKELIIEENIYPVVTSKLEMLDVDFNVVDDFLSYCFLSPWLALNQKNYELYRRGELDLQKVLIANILSDLKGVGIWVNKKIIVKGTFYKKEITLDNQKIIGFMGNFTCNVTIPSFIGTGKRKSIGFGIIVKDTMGEEAKRSNEKFVS
ncbi:CRISPR-associated endonuclease Cas6 [Thermospira aquatica]|uniref:DNA repair protein n=1 Tax=Thermospira aquatica TaxID=2828656 RepID=A0AAX3BII0_9SPIR|nr:CRISPR-associated endonuclease Cas6 [Thermospira aquatica]URA11176.1 hypothetical protein KDW03_05110 [Thermospira aquatica]